MAKKSSIEKNKRRRKMVARFAAKREGLLAIANDQSRPMEERFEARLTLAELPRNATGKVLKRLLRHSGDEAG